MPDQNELQIISGRLERGEIDGARFIEQLMHFVAGQIGCSRAGLRLFIDSPAGRALHCFAMYDHRSGQMVEVADIVPEHDCAYLERLQRDGSVTTTHALTDSVTKGAFRDYLTAAGVASLMDMGFSVNGQLFGVFSCEQIGEPVEWTQRQLQRLRKISSRASLSLMHVVNASVDTAPGALWESSTPHRLMTTMTSPLDPPSN